jgi:hypothetical protein
VSKLAPSGKSKGRKPIAPLVLVLAKKVLLLLSKNQGFPVFPKGRNAGKKEIARLP